MCIIKYDSFNINIGTRGDNIMKKTLFRLLAALLLFLTACSAEEPDKNQSTHETADEEVKDIPKEEAVEDPKESGEELTAETSQPLTIEKVQEIIEYHSLGEGDQLSNVSLENSEIKATIELAPNDLFPAKDMAVNAYSILSDELLKHEGWDILTVTYANVGTISMNLNEKETNEFGGDYFPTLVIEERLK
jgi:hypothetical protein